MIYIIETIEEDNSTALRRTYDSESEMLDGIAHLMEAMEILATNQMICITCSLW